MKVLRQLLRYVLALKFIFECCKTRFYGLICWMLQFQEQKKINKKNQCTLQNLIILVKPQIIIIFLFFKQGYTVHVAPHKPATKRCSTRVVILISVPSEQFILSQYFGKGINE